MSSVSFLVNSSVCGVGEGQDKDKGDQEDQWEDQKASDDEVEDGFVREEDWADEPYVDNQDTPSEDLVEMRPSLTSILSELLLLKLHYFLFIVSLFI
jgi:hypothetical protein